MIKVKKYLANVLSRARFLIIEIHRIGKREWLIKNFILGYKKTAFLSRCKSNFTLYV